MVSLKHRIPVRVRHYWKLLAVCALVVTGLVALAGNVRVTPLVTSEAEVKGDSVITDFAGTVDLFDHSKPHSISVSIDAVSYDRMLDNYIATGEKDFVRASLVIDGTHLPDVGLRLKGNSTLSALTHEGKTRNRFGGQMPRPPGGDQFLGGQFPAPAAGAGGVMPTARQSPRGPVPGPSAQATPAPSRPQPEIQRFGGPRSALDSARPEELPWLISFDEFVKGRRYQGRAELALRVSGMNGSLVMNEALSLDLLAQAGETTQRYTYASLRINDRQAKARLVVEHPDTSFAASLGEGVLYKSLATGEFRYQGEDATAYEDDFDQINGKGSYDIKPVIDLIKWVTTSSDADFAARLAEHVDVESFARYVAAQSLLQNFDDMSGPGRNYFLWYDLASKKFKVLSWDHNLTFTSMGRPLGPPAGGGNVTRVGPRVGHILKERFLAAQAFKPGYDAAHAAMKAKFFGSNAATATLDRIVANLGIVEGVDKAAVTSEADRLRPLLQAA